MTTATRCGSDRRHQHVPAPTRAQILMMDSIESTANRHHHLTPAQVASGATFGIERALRLRGYVVLSDPAGRDRLTESGAMALRQHRNRY